MYDFYLYAGKDEQKNDGPEISKLQKCARVFARLCDHLPKHSNHKLFCDNWFTTLDLLLYLKRIGIHVCGTVRSNRLQGCALNADKDLKRKGRGSLDYKSDMNSGIIVAKWYDNNAVHIASNFVGIEPMGTMERWSPQDKERKEIPCPQLVLQYNKGMDGFDLADMLISREMPKSILLGTLHQPRERILSSLTNIKDRMACIQFPSSCHTQKLLHFIFVGIYGTASHLSAIQISLFNNQICQIVWPK